MRLDAEFQRGWRVLLAACIGVGLGTTGLAFYSFGQFIRPLHTAFGWSRGDISAGLFCYSIGAIFMSPIAGRAVDRFGVRPVALIAQAGLACGFFLVSLAGPAIWSFEAGWVAISVLGAGTSPIVWSRAVAGLFVRRRGLALGLMLSGTGIAAILAPPVLTAVIDAYGWRWAERLLAASLLLIGLPVTFFLFRPGHARLAAPVDVDGLSLGQALRTTRFWRLVAAYLLIAPSVAGLIVHLPSMLVDKGYSPPVAAFWVGLLGYAVVAGRLGLGLLLDRFPARYVGALCLTLAAVTSLLLGHSSTLIIAVFLLGLCAGAEVDLLAYLISRYFGLRAFAQIYGCALSAFSFGAGAGPIIAGIVHDRTGSYTGALWGFACASVAAAALVFSLGRAPE